MSLMGLRLARAVPKEVRRRDIAGGRRNTIESQFQVWWDKEEYGLPVLFGSDEDPPPITIATVSVASQERDIANSKCGVADGQDHRPGLKALVLLFAYRIASLYDRANLSGRKRSRSV
jgi:hypothetical protein